MEKVQKEANKMYDSVLSSGSADGRAGLDKTKRNLMNELEDRLIVALISSYRL